MKELYIVRHGETLWNIEKRFQGCSNSELSELGKNQAKHMHNFFISYNFDYIISSPLKRAMDTAKIIKPFSVVNADDNIKEINLGNLEGKTYFDLDQSNSQIMNFWENPDKYIPDGGETFKEFEERISYFLNNVLSGYGDGKFLIISHGVAIRMMLKVIMKYDIKDIWNTPKIENTSVTKVLCDKNSFSIEYTGKTV
ncbi:MAG TPA: histidine phosphatase family protein [Tepiditoga sp.]|nr:histidine phosphatase family protein [Tepiditoga sp.]